MSFIEDVRDEDATGATAEFLAEARRQHGQVLNLHRACAHLPSLARHFEAMTAELKSRMGIRRYELVTIAAALALRSSYCALAHASVLIREGVAADEVARIAADRAAAGLTAAEREIMAFAEDIVRDAAAVEPARIDALRGFGLSDAEISEVAAAAALRCYFSKYLDALGTEPDAGYAALPASLREVLVRGRPIACSAEAAAGPA